jgi:mannose-6-phosphate isomerase-like protein (cupin superfamily)
LDAWEIADLLAQRAESGERYLDFFESADLSLGIYRLAAGEIDPQQPHTEDEIYYIVRGRGQISVSGEDRAVGPGSVVFVGTAIEHRFHSIEEDLEMLVVFAPPRRSRA